MARLRQGFAPYVHPKMALRLAKVLPIVTVRLRVGRNAYKGGHWLLLRQLSKMVNGECRQARELVSSCR